MSFVNTVDIIGDEALTNSILNGSITEIADNRVTSVGDSAFRGCSALIRADFPSVTGIYNTAFYDCSVLATLILRSETMCTLYYTGSFDGSPIAAGTGYIYVPSALYDSYRADSKWSTLANQFRKLEDYTVDGTVTGEVDPNRKMVRFFNDDGTFLCYVMVPNGGNAVYPGDEPVKGEDYAFTGWSPAPTNVTADMDCYAQFAFMAYYYSKIIDRTIRGAYTNTVATKIGARVFEGCSDLTSVVFPSATKIEGYAFAKCSNLTSSDFHVAKSISSFAFNACDNLSAFILRSGTVVAAESEYSIPSSIRGNNGYIYVPAALVDSYKSATNWSTYAAQFRAIEDYPEICGGEV